VLQNCLNKAVKFFLCIVFVLPGSFFNNLNAQSRTSGEEMSFIYLIEDSSDESSVETADQIRATFKYSNFSYTSIDIRNDVSIRIPESAKLIINTTVNIYRADQSQIQNLVEFVASGGSIIFLGAITTDEFSYLQGIKPFSDFTTADTVRGVKAIENIFPGFKGMRFYSPTSVPHNGIKAENFSPKIRVLATAFSDESYPLIIENTIGLGSVYVLNSGALFEKLYRGIIFSTILKALPNLPYRVSNVGTMFLDDFPAPLYNTKLEPIKSEYDVEQAHFVYNIWWPDMKAYADSVFMTYSAMTAFNYNANVVPPFDFNEWEAARLIENGREIKPSIEVARDIVRTRHEMAFHGYNHFSLNVEEWNSNKDFMVAALDATRKRWRVDDLGPLPRSYVPPTNYIDSTGIQALVKGMPSIKYMSSLYLGDIPDGGGREFGPDPYNSKLFDYPRSTSGFDMKQNSLFEQHGMQLLTGVWNHFVHPDDIFQILQREADAFESRNPDSLGWKSTPGKNTSMYQEFRKRITYTRTQYPFTRLVAAEYGAPIVQDWLASSTRYQQNAKNYIVSVEPPNKFKSISPDKEEKHWFMYVASQDRQRIESYLSGNVEGYSFSKYWDGFLFQFYSKKNALVIPRSAIERSSNSVKDKVVMAALNDLDSYQTEQNIETSVSVPVLTPEQLLQNSISRYLNNPRDRELQEDVIRLSIENDEAIRAIQVLEFRLRSTPTENWKQEDLDRLTTYYGYESATMRAENFLEELWRKFGNARVIAFKDQVATMLGLFSPEFMQRWQLREIEEFGGDTERVLEYTSSIESVGTWPEVKKRVLSLIAQNPESDSLYKYMIQRSFFYEETDSTIELLERFPVSAHDQLNEFADDFANIYGYERLEFEKALYWAERTSEISDRAKLGWLAEKQDFDQFEIRAREYLSKPNSPDSLRSYAGATLFYNQKRNEGYELLYPLFKNGISSDKEAQNLIDIELGYLSYTERFALFSEYPEFFSRSSSMRLLEERRWNEGIRFSAFGEYFSDNFDNQSARGGASIQFGNRREKTHLFKAEDIYINNSVGNQNNFTNFTGIGYEFEKRKADFSRTFKFNPSVFYGDEGLLGEVSTTFTFSKDSSFTSLMLSFEPEMTLQSIVEDIYKTKFEFYREDPWLNNNFLTTLSGNTQYYTNSVFDYSLTGRAYLQPWETSFRGRLIGEFGWQDASEQFANANPFFTQDDYLLKGLGLDMRYRTPNNFEYDSLLELEIMGKHANIDGYFMTGRLNLEHKFRKFWQVKAGTEFSTSSVYQSNRIFLTISYFFPKKIQISNN